MRITAAQPDKSAFVGGIRVGESNVGAPRKLLAAMLPSRPGGKNFLRRRNLFHRTGEAEFVFSSPASDMDLDGFQAAGLHSQAKLFIDFRDAVLLEAFAHD